MKFYFIKVLAYIILETCPMFSSKGKGYSWLSPWPWKHCKEIHVLMQITRVICQHNFWKSTVVVCKHWPYWDLKASPILFISLSSDWSSLSMYYLGYFASLKEVLNGKWNAVAVRHYYFYKHRKDPVQPKLILLHPNPTLVQST